MNKILVLAAHCDDESLGCGGTINRFINNGDDITLNTFSDCGIVGLVDESTTAAGVLGLRDAGFIYDFPVRHFPQHRQRILQTMIDANYIPDTVFVGSTFENHQDHLTLTQEAIRAFKHCTILGYELPWNNIESKHQCTIELTEQQVEKKIEACGMYKSQAHRPYMNPDFIRSWARMRGVQNGCEYAEVFEVIKLRL